MEQISKEDLERKISKHIQDGFQMDYDRMDNLVDVFKKEEVVENVMLELELYSKQQSIAFAKWIRENKWDYNVYIGYWVKQDHQNFKTITHTDEQLFNLFIEETKK
jgi:hypothetical protein